MSRIPQDWFNATTALGTAVALFAVKELVRIYSFNWWVLLIGSILMAIVSIIEYLSIIFKK